MSRYRWLLAVIVVIALLALWWVFLISPRRGDVDELNAARDTAVNRQQTLRAERAALLDIQENELTYITAAAALERLIPATPDLATFFDDVTLLAATTGVRLNAISPTPPAIAPLDEFQEVTVIVDLDGQFFEILGFLYGLADMERLVRIDGLSMAPTEGANGEIFMATSLDLTIFTTSTVTVADPGAATGAETTTTTTTTTVPAGDTGALGVGP